MREAEAWGSVEAYTRSDPRALLRHLTAPCRQVGTGADGQLACYNACLRKYRDTTDWFLAAVSL